MKPKSAAEIAPGSGVEAEPKAKRSPKQHVAVRLTPEDVARIDALIPRLGTEWMRVSRSDVLRMLLHRGLDTVEREMARDGGAAHDAGRPPKPAGREP